MRHAHHPADWRRTILAARSGAAAFLGAMALWSVTSAQAHEIGTTRVLADVSPPDTYTIEVVTDADTLLARLEVARKLPRSGATDTARLQQGFDALCSDIPAYLTVTFDGVASAPQATCLVETLPDDADRTLTVPGVKVTLRGSMQGGATTFTWRYELTYASYALIVRSGDPTKPGEQTIWLDADRQSPPIELTRVEPPPSAAATAQRYFTLGFTHILPGGPDHVLFVLGIFLLSRSLRPMVWQISAFTIAHSVTLGLTMYGIISLPASIVESLIALSIVYVAVENLLTSDLKVSRVALVFAFGLLHGMGFAGVLSELALPRGEYLTGLVAFNAGVEASQLTIILSAFLIVGRWAPRWEGYRRFIVVPGSAAIAVVGLFWMVQRLVV